MKTFVAFIALCLVSANAYKPFGPNMSQPVVPQNTVSINKHVVGGKDATAYQAPWQISMVKSSGSVDNHICGGSLIASNTVLTAAHCCDGLTASVLKVKYGGTDRNKLATTNLVSKMTMHPNYSSSTVDCDYCILCINDAAKTSSSVQIIPIASVRPANDSVVHLTGWGLTSSDSTLPNKLQYAQMSLLCQPDCNEKWKDINTVTPNMICACSKTASGCNGDSGGPLVAKNSNITQLIGVVSWGANGCPADTTQRPSVYADCITGKKWIDDQIMICSQIKKPVQKPSSVPKSGTKSRVSILGINLG